MTWLQVGVYVAAAYGLWVLLTFSAASLVDSGDASNSAGEVGIDDIVVKKAEALSMAMVGTLLGLFYVLPFIRLLVNAKSSVRRSTHFRP